MKTLTRRAMFVAALALAAAATWTNTSLLHAADSDGGFDTLDAACKDLALQIDKALTSEKIQGSIVIQAFTNGSAFPNAQISRLLTGEFEKKSYKVSDKGGAPAFVKGTLFVNKTSLVIETDLHRSGEGRLQTWRHRVNSLEAASQGTTFDATSVASASTVSTTKKQEEKVAEAIKQDSVKPEVAVTNETTVARPSPSSNFGVSIVDAKTGKPLPIVNVEGVAVVQLAMKQEFTLHILNDSKHDVGASISLDGVNMFVFSENEAYKKLGKIWISPGGGDIDGWYHNDAKSRRFQMGTYDESVAAQTGVTEGVGGITVTIYGDPNDVSASKRTFARPEVGIAAGSEVQSDYKTKEGNFGELIAAVTVRYQKSDHPTDLPPGGK